MPEFVGNSCPRRSFKDMDRKENRTLGNFVECLKSVLVQINVQIEERRRAQCHLTSFRKSFESVYFKEVHMI